jgi:hypothetical protein
MKENLHKTVKLSAHMSDILKRCNVQAISSTYSWVPTTTEKLAPASGRRVPSPAEDASMLNRSFLPLFPFSSWTDINADLRIQPQEVRPLDPARAELLESIDLNGDGISYDEMLRYVSGGRIVDPDKDIRQIYDDLAASGSHELAGAPVLIVMDDKVPRDILNMPFYCKAADLIKKGSIITYGISRNGGFSSSPTYDGAKKFVLIVFPKDKTLSLSRIYVESMISHELVHARQYISGKRMEFDSIYYFMHSSGKFSQDDIRNVSASLPSALGEIEAYKHEMMNALPEGDLSRLQYFAIYLNSQMRDVDSAIELFNSKNAQDLVKLIESMLDEVLPKESAAVINSKIKLLADSCGESSPVLVKRTFSR